MLMLRLPTYQTKLYSILKPAHPQIAGLAKKAPIDAVGSADTSYRPI
jgi:hypothetical protein